MEPLETNSAVPRRDQSPFLHERRQSPRHKVHTPAYASFNGVSHGMVLDLSEIVDIRETAAADYMSIQAALHAVEREIESLGSDLDAGLQSLAERAQAFTRATGAAIALAQKEEQPQEMVCRASTGSDAPGPGARLHVGSGFSVECVRTGKLLRCDDSETDPLVDAEICRLLGIRSMIAVPVRDAEKVIGLLEVFSPAPYAFQETDNTILQGLAGIILAAVNRARIPQSESAPDAEGTRLAGPPPSPGSVSESLIASASDVPQFEGIPVPRSHLMLLIAVAASLALALGLLLAPWIECKRNRSSPPQP